MTNNIQVDRRDCPDSQEEALLADMTKNIQIDRKRLSGQPEKGSPGRYDEEYSGRQEETIRTDPKKISNQAGKTIET
jgi:hypothetical protein